VLVATVGEAIAGADLGTAIDVVWLWSTAST